MNIVNSRHRAGARIHRSPPAPRPPPLSLRDHLDGLNIAPPLEAAGFQNEQNSSRLLKCIKTSYWSYSPHIMAGHKSIRISRVVRL
jgi:hypothetical protein